MILEISLSGDTSEKKKKGRKPSQKNYFDIREESAVIEFLNSDKYNYYGQYPCELNTYIAPLNLIKNILMIIII